MESYLYQDLYKLEDLHWWHRAKRAAVLDLIKKYNRWSRPRLLDIGCGTGKNVEVFSSLGETAGLDISAEALAFCKKRGLKKLYKGTAEATKLPARSIDIISLLDVLEHVDEQKTLTEMHRILTADGLLIINVPAFQWLWSRWDEVLHHKRRYTKAALVKALSHAHFEVISISYLFSFLVLPALVIRKIKSILYPRAYPSDFSLKLPMGNNVLYFICRLEFLLTKYLSLPLGTSCLCVARKI